MCLTNDLNLGLENLIKTKNGAMIPYILIQERIPNPTKNQIISITRMISIKEVEFSVVLVGWSID